MADTLPVDTSPFAHIVFFSLVDRSVAARQHLVGQCHEYLAGHEGLLYFGVGVISDNDRDVNDRDFDVALHTVFDSRDAHDAYQVTPRHKQFIENNRSSWSGVRVFDSNLT